MPVETRNRRLTGGRQSFRDSFSCRRRQWSMRHATLMCPTENVIHYRLTEQGRPLATFPAAGPWYLRRWCE